MIVNEWLKKLEITRFDFRGLSIALDTVQCHLTSYFCLLGGGYKMALEEEIANDTKGTF